MRWAIWGGAFPGDQKKPRSTQPEASALSTQQWPGQTIAPVGARLPGTTSRARMRAGATGGGDVINPQLLRYREAGVLLSLETWERSAPQRGHGAAASLPRRSM